MNILITGGASGLGKVISTQLAQNTSNHLLITYKDSFDAAMDLANGYENISTIRCDFNRREDIQTLFEKMLAFDVDVLINNAISSMQNNHFHKIARDSFIGSYISNVLPTLELAQQAIKIFRKKKFGKIITILSSYLVNRPPIGLSEYVANKSYLLSMSKSWAVENANFNITSNCISPSIMKTGLTKNIDDRVVEGIIENHPLHELITPDEVCKAVKFILESRHANGINIVLNMAENVI